MKYYLFSILFFTLSVSITANSQRVLKGMVRAGNKGIANVIIANGKNFTTTRPDGTYTLHSDTTQAYVYYTLPSGYESPVENGIPVFYKWIEASTDRYDFNLKKSAVSQKKHAFIVWADPQVIDPEEFKLLEGVAKDVTLTVEEYKQMPVHAICCGDIVFDRLNLFDDYKKVLTKINVPFYQSIGNHDMDYSNKTHETSTRSYEANFGPAYYSYNKGDIHYIVLNDVFYYGYSYQYMGYLDQRQLDWLTQDLSHVDKGSTVVITLHIPTMYIDAETNPSLEKLQKNSLVNNKHFYEKLKGYDVHLLAGHSHTQWNTIVNDSILEHTHAAASAAWWQGEVGLDGTPKGYSVYEADGNKLVWRFKGTGLPKDHQFKVYPVGADPDNSEAFVVNVYNYDPQWTVVWYENNILQGNMEQYCGVDPLACELYQPGQNKKYGWLCYDKTNHIFKATPKQKGSDIRVEVTDRFGNKWSETLKNDFYET